MDDLLVNGSLALAFAVVLGTLFVAGWSRKADLPGVVWLLGPALLQIAALACLIYFHGAALTRSRHVSPEAAQSVLSEGMAISMYSSGAMYLIAAGVLGLSALFLLVPQRDRDLGPRAIFVALLAWQALSVGGSARLARGMGATFRAAAETPPELRQRMIEETNGSLSTERLLLWGIGLAALALTSTWALIQRKEQFAEGRVWMRATAVVAVLVSLSVGRVAAQQILLVRVGL